VSSDDVVALIEADHREVERLFELLKSNPGRRPLYLPVLSSLLVAHSRAEESAVYPIARSEAGETDEVAHSQEEHIEAEQLLKKLMETDYSSPDFDTALEKLVEAVTHHVEEEESDVLPGIRNNIAEERRMELATEFANARAEHLGDKPGDESRQELAGQAKNMGIEGAGNKSKEELKNELQDEVE
jgi:hemerythrin superfamily protein